MRVQDNCIKLGRRVTVWLGRNSPECTFLSWQKLENHHPAPVWRCLQCLLCRFADPKINCKTMCSGKDKENLWPKPGFGEGDDGGANLFAASDFRPTRAEAKERSRNAIFTQSIGEWSNGFRRLSLKARKVLFLVSYRYNLTALAIKTPNCRGCEIREREENTRRHQSSVISSDRRASTMVCGCNERRPFTAI